MPFPGPGLCRAKPRGCHRRKQTWKLGDLGGERLVTVATVEAVKAQNVIARRRLEETCHGAMLSEKEITKLVTGRILLRSSCRRSL